MGDTYEWCDFEENVCCRCDEDKGVCKCYENCECEVDECICPDE